MGLPERVAIRGYAAEAMAWSERKRIGYIFGLAGNPVLLRQVSHLAEDAAIGRIDVDKLENRAPRIAHVEAAYRVASSVRSGVRGRQESALSPLRRVQPQVS